MDQKERVKLMDELMTVVQYKSKQNWKTTANKAEAEELVIYSSLRTLRETLKNNPGTIEDAF
jgi:hypothetical protein